jgi:CPA1 family monovalent cation:H+ antiporter
MEGVTISLFLLLAVVISGMLARMSPVPVPLPLVQIALGAIIAVGTGSAITLEPTLFFLLFLPPLLFLDGWRIPQEGLFHDKGTILELALGLVIFTVVGMGFLIHWMVPAIPLSVAFALAAILSPTDPIAVSAITARVPMPKRLMHILEGESLLNDASGLVCMRFAIAATLTGTFSAGEAVVTFLWLAIGGVAVGLGVTWLITRAKDVVSRTFGEETGSQILISILIPFGAYLLAEHLHCSGILAAVAAGIAMSYEERRGKVLAVTRVRRAAVWDTVQFTMNGIIFVLLGEQLPGIVSGAARVVSDTGHLRPVWLAVYVVAITLALAVLRLAWVYVSLRFTLLFAARRGEVIRTPSWRLVVAISVAGVRGAITLAGILTLPLVMNDGSPFPARDLVIFLAAGVIIVSLIIASIGLPILLKDLEMPPEPSHQREEDDARIAASKAAIRAIEATQHRLAQGHTDADVYAEVGTRLMEIYRQRIDGRSKTGDESTQLRKGEEIERLLRVAGARAERDVILKMARARKLPDETARKLVREIDLTEARLSAGG